MSSISSNLAVGLILGGSFTCLIGCIISCSYLHHIFERSILTRIFPELNDTQIRTVQQLIEHMAETNENPPIVFTNATPIFNRVLQNGTASKT